MTWLADKFAPLRAGVLIPSDKSEPYLQAMDEALKERVASEVKHGVERSRGNGYSSWFQGQNIHLDVFGGYAKSWSERTKDEDKFRSETL